MKWHVVLFGVVVCGCALGHGVGRAEEVEAKPLAPISLADALRRPVEDRAVEDRPVGDVSVGRDAGAVASAMLELAERVYGLGEGTPHSIRHHRIGGGATALDRGQPPEGFDDPVYVNEPSPALVFPPGVDRLIADDLLPVAGGGCSVSGYEIKVGRSVNWCSATLGACETDGDCSGTAQTCEPRPDPGFTVTFALYDGCPGQGGQIIPGTEGSEMFAEDGLFTILVDFGGNNIPAGSAVWLGTTFDKSGAGWVVGTPAFTGFSLNVYHHPMIPCFAGFSGIYAGFHAKVFCSPDPPFEREFLGYLNAELNGGPFIPGGGQWIADDVTLIVDDCILSSYEIGSVGGAPYTVTAEIWRFCDESTVVEGTQGVFQSAGGGTPELARFSFPDGILLDNGADYWVAWKYNNSSTAAILADEAELGESDDIFGLPGIGCGFWFGGVPEASFSIRIRCLGEVPVGACCRRAAENMCAVTQGTACIQPGDEWNVGALCDPDPFAAPCGTLACCVPDPAPRGGCENLTPEACQGRGGVTRPNLTCESATSECIWFPCQEAEGDCCVPGGEVACHEPFCCNSVCNNDAWCCTVEWDWICAWEAGQLCNPSCPGGAVALVDPPEGVVDARQPHAIEDAAALQGIDTLVVEVPGGSSACCWSICEPITREVPNHITALTHHGDGTATITLAFPIATPGTTTLFYDADFSGGPALSVKTLPGDVDGNLVANPADILALIDGLNGAVTLPWGVYSCDLDRSGACGPEDILRAIDLLHGAGAFEPWIDTPLPASDCP